MPQTDAASIGETVIDAIIKGGLVGWSEADGLYVWSANAPEQIGQAVVERHIAPLGRDLTFYEVAKELNSKLEAQRNAALAALREVVEAMGPIRLAESYNELGEAIDAAFKVIGRHRPLLTGVATATSEQGADHA